MIDEPQHACAFAISFIPDSPAELTHVLAGAPSAEASMVEGELGFHASIVSGHVMALARYLGADRQAYFPNGLNTGTSKRSKSRTFRVATVSLCTIALAAIMASS
jgi:hypothetical protein